MQSKHGGRARGQTTLIVDDDARVTELLSRYLSSVGYLTSCSLDAATAINLINEQEFDLLVVDSLPNFASRNVIFSFQGETPFRAGDPFYRKC